MQQIKLNYILDAKNTHTTADDTHNFDYSPNFNCYGENSIFIYVRSNGQRASEFKNQTFLINEIWSIFRQTFFRNRI